MYNEPRVTRRESAAAGLEEIQMKLRLGFVGVGGIAGRHLGYSAKRSDVEIVGHADVDPARAKAAAEKYGGRAYVDFRELYDREKPEAIVISTPPFAHGEIEEEACKRGIHFFVEKPVAVSLELAARVKRAVDSSGALAQVGYMFRFSEGVLKVKELLKDRKIALVQEHFYMPGLPPPAWWPKLSLSGGQLIEQATHMLDLGRFLAGEVVSVSGRTARVHDWTPPPGSQPQQGMRSYADGFDIPDTTVLTMQYESGALGTLSCSMIPQVEWDSGFKIVAEGILVTLDGPNASWASAESGTCPAGADWASYVLYDFIDAVKQGRKRSTVPYDEGVKSLAISIAGYASVAKGGAPVSPQQLLRQAGISC